MPLFGMGWTGHSAWAGLARLQIGLHLDVAWVQGAGGGPGSRIWLLCPGPLAACFPVQLSVLGVSGGIGHRDGMAASGPQRRLRLA